tara:strand:+ start:1803 stop:2069 length:267 start_codon:yes stop_codon:yes gene_type:complete
MTETCPSPLLKWPTMKRAVLPRQIPSLLDSIRAPARRKNGIASIGKLCVGVQASNAPSEGAAFMRVSSPRSPAWRASGSWRSNRTSSP